MTLPSRGWRESMATMRKKERCLRTNADDLNARNLAALLLRELGRRAEADERLTATLKLDPLDPWAGHLANGAFTADDQTRLDVAFDYARAGFYRDASRLLEMAKAPMLMYVRAFCEVKLGRGAQESLAAAAEASPDYCFPARLEEMLVLQFAIEVNPPDARALLPWQSAVRQASASRGNCPLGAVRRA